MFSLSGFKVFLKSCAFGIPAGITLIDVFGYVAKVEGTSMQPLLNPDPAAHSDYVFLYNWPLVKNAFNTIQRGEIIALISPRNPKQRLIKRVIGIPGDVIRAEPNISSEKVVRIPAGHLWVEGDNRGRSYDSTTFGPIALGLVKSKATAIVWPPSRWQILDPFILSDRVPLNFSTNNNKSSPQNSVREEGSELIPLTKPPIL